MRTSLEARAQSARQTSKEPLTRRVGPWAFKAVVALTIFMSAFLLFQVELILGKFLLPWFGGASEVWATCMVFFQLALFAGYFYSHKLSNLCDLSYQARFHLLVLAVAGLLVLLSWYSWHSPILPDASWKPVSDSSPALGILKLLLLTIGVPFLVLSSTGPLLQKWYHDIQISHEAGPPYFLYALSNGGSLLGLLSYPVLLEPSVGLDKQSRIWGAAFLFFLVCCATCAWIVSRLHRQSTELSCAQSNHDPSTVATSSALSPKFGVRQKPWLWFTLAALGSMILLATTNLVTQDVAPVPLLWVLPLSLYLLTFVLTFQTRSWYRRGLFHPLFATTAVLAVIALYRGANMHVLKQLAVFLGMLFAACMICHGELARLKPDGKHLTAFYLTVAAGGAAGGIFVGVIAPVIFPAIWEYHITLWAIAAVLSFILFADKQSWLHDSRPDPWILTAFGAMALLIPKHLAGLGMITIPTRIAPTYNTAIAIVVIVLALMTVVNRWLPRPRWPAYKIIWFIGFLGLTGALFAHLAKHNGELVYRVRNFYGALSVERAWDTDMLHSRFTLKHGRIVHGIQLQQDPRLATTYYGANSGVGLALTATGRKADRPIRIGAIGLGAGTIATYGRPGDVYHFYEINPAIIRLAKGAGGYFSFLKDSRAQIEIQPGDARLSMELEAGRGEFQNFDVLIVDAFNGDSIPVHLLTRQAMRVYLLHLRDRNSVIAVHISNLAVDLAPVVASLADFYGLRGTLVTGVVDNSVILQSEWILLTRGDSLNTPEIQSTGKPILAFGDNDAKQAWTDDYTNVSSLLNYHGLSLKLLPH